MLAFFFTPASFSGPAELQNLKTLDGVKIEAVESYWNPKQNEISLGFGFYGFNAYYNALSMNAGYQYHFNRKAGWEILHIGYFSTFAKGLTTELADKYSVNPSSIERLNLVLSSHFDYIFMNGKFVFFEEYIRYFRTSVMLGGSFVLTNFSNYIAGDIGLRFEIFSGKVFTWKLEIRDSIAFATATQYVTFNLGIGFDF